MQCAAMADAPHCIISRDSMHSARKPHPGSPDVQRGLSRKLIQ